MTLDEYQQQALKTAVNTYDPLTAKTVWAMGVAGEAGEVVEKWKKIIAYQDGKYTQEQIDELAKELGDVVWYVAVFAHELGFTFEEIMQRNVDKLKSRKAREVIKGAGDNR
jgi:NTP pyrophosphatase (non-canonical NTP hydrolase)